MISVGFVNPPDSLIVGEIYGGANDGTPIITFCTPENIQRPFTVTIGIRAAVVICRQLIKFIEYAEGPMNAEDTIDTVTGLVMSYKSNGFTGPYIVTLPAKCQLFIDQKVEDGTDLTLKERLKKIEGVVDVVVGKGSGTSISQKKS